jgi:hypothetical protein
MLRYSIIVTARRAGGRAEAIFVTDADRLKGYENAVFYGFERVE